jgi:predicted nucleotidyltransferase
VADLAAGPEDTPAAEALADLAAAAVAEAARREAGEGRERMSSIDSKLAELVKRLRGAANTNLESVVLFGSAARGDFWKSYSDLNVFCTLRALTLEELSLLSPVVQWWIRKQGQPAPLFFTAEELLRSADVFAIELLDMQRNHQVLYGPDVLTEIVVPMNLHRVQVEHELRTMLLKLRQQYLQSSENQDALRAVLSKSYSGALTLLRHALIALGQEPQVAPREVFARISAETGADARAFEAGLELRETGKLSRDLASAYGAYLSALEKVISALDQHLPKREWKRTRRTDS